MTWLVSWQLDIKIDQFKKSGKDSGRRMQRLARELKLTKTLDSAFRTTGYFKVYPDKLQSQVTFPNL